MLTFAEARARLLENVPLVGLSRVGLDRAGGRVLREAVAARGPLPPFDGSAMDGYAIATATLSGAGPWTLPLIGESKTGSPPPDLAPGAVCRIFTGAMLPPGADAVVMQEDVRREGDRVTFSSRPGAYAHVRRAGEDLAEGVVALSPGTRLTAAHVALAATLERAELAVSRRPVVGVLATGDELRLPGSPSRPGTIPESNGVALATMARSAGAEAHVLPIVGDDADATTAAIESALRTIDVLITVGGVSVGDHDVVRPALERAGVVLDFWKVAMKPGKPLAIGRRGEVLVLGLPGNPVSALVTFALFGVPLLRALQGDKQPVARPLRARLGRSVGHARGRMEFVRATLDLDDSGFIASPLVNQASGAIASLALADALIVVPADAEGIPAGEWVDIIRLADL